MTEERITETTTPTGETHTTHTVITDGERRSGGANWGMLVLLVLVAIVGIFLFTQMSGSEVAKDNAVAEAANEVGDAASEVGEAAQNAGEAVEDAVAN